MISRKKKKSKCKDYLFYYEAFDHEEELRRGYALVVAKSRWEAHFFAYRELESLAHMRRPFSDLVIIIGD